MFKIKAYCKARQNSFLSGGTSRLLQAGAWLGLPHGFTPRSKHFSAGEGGWGSEQGRAGEGRRSWRKGSQEGLGSGQGASLGLVQLADSKAVSYTGCRGHRDPGVGDFRGAGGTEETRKCRLLLLAWPQWGGIPRGGEWGAAWRKRLQISEKAAEWRSGFVTWCSVRPDQRHVPAGSQEKPR